MFNNKLEKRIKEMEERLWNMEERNMNFLVKANEIMGRITDNDKKKFMYDLMQEDIELIEEGKKVRAIRKIVN